MLETLGYSAYPHGLRRHLSTAHPHFDFQRKYHYGYPLEFGWPSRYHLYRIVADTGRQARVVSVMVPKPAYVHSFGITERYLIFAEFPLVVDPLLLRLGVKPFIRNHVWEPDRGVRFQVIDKETGCPIKSARSAPCFGFHHVNPFERDGEIVADIVTFPDANVINQLYLDRLRSSQPVTTLGKLTRFHIDLGGGRTVANEGLSEAPIEFPRIHYRNHAGQLYRYVYGIGNEVPGNFSDTQVKLDLETQQTTAWRWRIAIPENRCLLPLLVRHRKMTGLFFQWS